MQATTKDVPSSPTKIMKPLNLNLAGNKSRFQNPMDISRNSDVENSVNETFASTNTKFSFGNSIKKVFITFDRDLAHKLFGYRLRFLEEEMKSFAE